MAEDPILSRLGLARCAGRISVGYAASKEAVVKHISRLVIIASDISAKTEKEARFVSKENVPVTRISRTIDEVSTAIGVKGGVISVNDEGFAATLLKLIKEESQYDDDQI